MGCLNSDGSFTHWFGNIHLSGPCNRSCYFCIGQHMMVLDPLNTLETWPLPGIDEFVRRCQDKGVREVNLTGSNTDPLLYKFQEELETCLRKRIDGVRIGIRTNGVALASVRGSLHYYDKASISVTSLDPDLYQKTMGGPIPDLALIVEHWKRFVDLKANVVLCDETKDEDIFRTVEGLADLGFHRINVREPYGQPHIGDVLSKRWQPVGAVFSSPVYSVRGALVCYWDVHWVGVESVNLYANGVVSLMYPVTRGHVKGNGGEVLPQEKFTTSGRIRPQWLQEDQPPARGERRGG